MIASLRDYFVATKRLGTLGLCRMERLRLINTQVYVETGAFLSGGRPQRLGVSHEKGAFAAARNKKATYLKWLKCLIVLVGRRRLELRTKGL